MIRLPGFYGNTATEAFRTAADRRLLPTWLGSAELGELARSILDRAVFSARTTSAVYLDALRERIGRLLADGYEGDQAQLRLELKQILAELGYDPELGFPGDEELGIPPALPGSLQDLSGDARINLILETQLELMAGKGQEQRGLSPEALDLFPAWELVRLRPVRLPRDWPRRWNTAGGRALIDSDGRLRLAAHKLDEVWSVLGDPAIFRDALGVSHPPFCFRSGMGWAPIEAAEWDALLQFNGRTAERPATAPPASAKELPPAVVSTDGLSADTLAKLKSKLEGVEARDGKLTLGKIIGTPPPPPPPSRLRRLNALCDALLGVAMAAEVNAGNRAGALKGWETRRRQRSRKQVARDKKSIRQGVEAMLAVIAGKKDVLGAMRAPGLGTIDFLWGARGMRAADAHGSTHRFGWGVHHVRDKRPKGIAMIPIVLTKGTVHRHEEPGKRIVRYGDWSVIVKKVTHGRWSVTTAIDDVIKARAVSKTKAPGFPLGQPGLRRR